VEGSEHVPIRGGDSWLGFCINETKYGSFVQESQKTLGLQSKIRTKNTELKIIQEI
jgi:hypothetical protein